MEWNAFSLAEPAIDRTKDLLFPIIPRYWAKLTLVSIFSVGNGFSGGWGGNGWSGSGFSNEKSSNITGNVISGNSLVAGVIGAVIFCLSVLYLAWTYVSSVFSFIFYDALVYKKYSIKSGWEKNRNLGISFFGFRIIASLVFILVSVLIFLPIIFKLITNGLDYFKIIFSSEALLIVIPSVIIFILWMIIYRIFISFVIDFSIVDMYRNKIGIKKSIKNMMGKVRSFKIESFVYLLAGFVFGIAIGILSLLVLIPFLIFFGLIGLGVFFGLSYGLGLSDGWIWIILIPYILFALYSFIVLLLPFSVFKKYFSILAYEKLFGIKVLSKKAN